MKPTRIGIGFSALLFLLAAYAPTVYAVHGTAPTLTCSQTFTPGSGESTVEWGKFLGEGAARLMDVSDEGFAYAIKTTTRSAAPTTTTTNLVKYAPNCSQMASATPDCEGDDGVNENTEIVGFSAVKVSRGGRIIVAAYCVQDGVTDVHLATYHPDTLARIDRTKNLAINATPPATGAPYDVDSVKINDTSEAYLIAYPVSTNTRIVKYSFDMDTELFSVSSGVNAVLRLSCCDSTDTNFFTTQNQVGYKRLMTTGASQATVTIETSLLSAGDPTAQIIATYNSPTLAYAASSTGSGAATGMARVNVTIAAWTAAETAYSPSQIGFSPPTQQRDSNWYWMDLDGNDNQIICGHMDAGAPTPRGFVAFDIPGFNNHQYWNVTQINDSVTESCEIGPSGEVWALADDGSTGSGKAYLYRYEGGGVAGTFTRNTVLLPEPETPEVFAPVDFGSGLANFAADIGFASEGGLFFFGLILVIIMFLVVAGATKGVTDNDFASGIGGAISGLGTMVFNTTQELWPAWATVILIVLTSAVILWFTRGLFLGGGVEE